MNGSGKCPCGENVSMTFQTHGETVDVCDDMARPLTPQLVGRVESVVVRHSASGGACSRVKDSSRLMSLASLLVSTSSFTG